MSDKEKHFLKRNKTVSNQLMLFESIKAKPITFSSLSIHEKINYKANQCGFGGTVYLSRYNYFHSPLYKPRFDSLSKEYYWHYNVNSGGSNRIDNWIKKKTLKKSLF